MQLTFMLLADASGYMDDMGMQMSSLAMENAQAKENSITA